MILALKPIVRSLTRLGLTIVVGSSLATTIGLLYPTQRELDLARYSYASYATEVQGVFPAPLEPDIARAVGGEACLVSEWTTELRAGSSSVGPTQLDAMSPACGTVSRFPARSLVSGSSTHEPAWIDLSADTAGALGVSPGDTVSVVVGPGIAPVRLSVRNIFAVRGSLEFAAQAPAHVLFAHLPSGAEPGYGLALTRTTPAHVLANLDMSPVRKDLVKIKGYPPTVTAVADRLDAASRASTHSLGLVRTVGTLCAIGIAMLGLRELDVFRRRAQPVLLHVHRLGGPVRKLLVTVFALATGTACLTGTLGVAIGAAAYRFGWIASCLPPATTPLLVACWASLSGFCALVGIILATASARQVGR